MLAEQLERSRGIILQVYGGSPKKKGSLEDYFLKLSLTMQQEGYASIFVFNREIEEHLAKLYQDVGASIITIPDTIRRFDLAMINRFRKLFRELKPSLVNFHFGRACSNGLLAAYLSGVFNTVWTKHSFYERGPFYRSVPQLKILTSMILLQGLMAKRVIAVSDGIKKELLQYHIPDSKIARIYLGINLDRFGSASSISAIRQELGIAKEARIFSCISQARQEKGLEYLIRALPKVMEMFPDIKVLLVGGGPLTESLRELARQLLVDNHIVFCGVRNDVERIISASEFMVLPSLTEAQGLVILEAFACGKPVIASSVGGIPEVITDEVNGLLVPPKDVDSLAERMIRLLQDTKSRQRMGMAAVEKAKMFDVNIGVERTIELYHEVMNQHV